MPFDAGSIRGTITLDFGPASRVLTQVQNTTNDAMSRASAAIARYQRAALLAGAAFASIGAAGILAGRQMVGAAAQMERYEAQFSVLTGSIEAARKRLEALVSFAAKTPFDLPGIVEADRLIQAFNLDIGGLEKSLRTYGDAAAGMGVPIQEVIPIMAKLKAGMFEIEQMARLGITREALAKFGIQFTKTGEVINRKDLFPAAIELLSRFDGMMDKVSKTAEGRFSNMRDAIFQTSAALGKALLPVVKEYTDAITESLNKVQAWVEANPEAAKAQIDLAAKIALTTAEIGRAHV